MNISSEPYDFDSPAAVSGVLPHGAGFGKRDLGDLVGLPLPLQTGQQLLGALGMFWAASALVALARILLAWSVSVLAFFSAFCRSRLRRFSSVSRCCW